MPSGTQLPRTLLLLLLLLRRRRLLVGKVSTQTTLARPDQLLHNCALGWCKRGHLPGGEVACRHLLRFMPARRALADLCTVRVPAPSCPSLLLCLHAAAVPPGGNPVGMTGGASVAVGASASAWQALAASSSAHQAQLPGDDACAGDGGWSRGVSTAKMMFGGASGSGAP